MDFLTINDPTAPTDTHPQFVKLLDATADAAGAEPLFGSGLGELDLADLAASNLQLAPQPDRQASARSPGRESRGACGQADVPHRDLIDRVPDLLDRHRRSRRRVRQVHVRPVSDENRHRAVAPGERHLTEEWRQRQSRGDIEFTLNWLPFIDEQTTSMTELTRPWEQQPVLIGQVTFPKIEAADADAPLWAALASELGANAGNWVADTGNTIPEPGTEFTCARKLAYRNSQAGRNVLPEADYAHVFGGAPIGPTLAAELQRRRAAKDAAKHMNMAR